jgi:hypothetical protein
MWRFPGAGICQLSLIMKGINVRKKLLSHTKDVGSIERVLQYIGLDPLAVC